MNVPKHTPGPWTLQPLGDEFPSIRILPNQRIVGANRISPGIVFGGLGEETDANASLMKASPDLLAAAKLTLRAMDSIGQDVVGWTDEYAALEAAVKKAETL